MASPRQRLSREAILDAALTIIDEGGLESCTMRAVAAELGVEAMSLYWHVPGKEALLDGVVQRMLDGAPAFVHRDDWREELYGVAQSMRGALLMHPNGIPLLSGRALGHSGAGAMIATTLGTLEAAGFDRLTAIRAARTIYRYVIGYLLVESSVRAAPDGPAAPSNPDQSPLMAEFAEALATEPSSDLFDFGLHTLLDGLAVSLSSPDPG